MDQLTKRDATPRAGNAPEHYRADIDGVRAVAVAIVVAFHAFPRSMPGGFIGVDVFFVISGFLITGLVLDGQAAKTFSIKNFYIRRARRILPALALVLAATLLVGAFILLPGPYARLGWEALAGALFFPNFVFWSEAGYFDTAAITKPLLHLWSLGVEEQFYLVWPLTLVLLRRSKAPLALILGVITALSLVYSSVAAFSDPTAAFYSPVSRLWELGVGGVLAAWPLKPRFPQVVSLTGLALIAASALTITSTSPFPGLLAILPVGGAAMTLIGRSWLLSRRPFVSIGLISYPLYLWHWPLLSFAAIRGSDAASTRFALVALSVALAWLTTRYVERPIRFGEWRPYGFRISTLATAAVACAALMVFLSNGLPIRYPAEIRPVLATMDTRSWFVPARARTCWLDVKLAFSEYRPECSVGEVAIWGDSYSALLGTGLPRPYAQFSRDGCLPLLTDDESRCAESNKRVVGELLRRKPHRVILFGAWLFHDVDWQHNRTFMSALQNTLHALRNGVDDVVLVGPSPSWPPSLPEVVFKLWTETGALPDRLKIDPHPYASTNSAFRSAAQQVGIRFISFFDTLCNIDGCLTHTPASRSDLLMWDQGHLTLDGASYVARALGLVAVPDQARTTR